MATMPISQVHRQVRRAHGRLFWQTWLNGLPVCCSALLLLAAGWLMVQPYLMGSAEQWLRWTLLGGAVAVGAIVALMLALAQGPSRLEAALALDERFGLKERVTTTLMLPEEQAQSPAGLALLEDVDRQLTKISVPTRFPLRLSWRQALVPAVAAVLAVLAVFFAPDIAPVSAESQDPNLLAKAQADAIEKKLDEMKKKLEEKKKDPQSKSKALQELDLKMEQIFDKTDDPTSKDENRKKAEDIQKLEQENDKLLKEAQAAQQKKAELDQKIKELDKLTETKDDKGKDKDGPGKDLLDAIAKGDNKKAEEEVKKLQDKLENNKLSGDEKKKLEEQIGEAQKQAEKIAKQEENEKKKLDDAKKSGEASKDQLKKLEEQTKKQEESKKLSDSLKECQQCMKDGDGKKASDKLGEAAGKMQQATAQKKEMEKESQKLDEKAKEAAQLQQNQKMLQDARQTICQNLDMNGNQPGGQKDGQKGGQKGASKNAGSGPRPSEKTDTGSKDQQLNADTDTKGQFKIVGDGPIMTGTKTMIPNKELPGVFEQTAQQEQQAIERLPISTESAELLKGYYQNLSGQKK